MKWYSVVKRKRCPLINSIFIDALRHKYRTNLPINYTTAQKDIIFIDGYWFFDEEKEDKQRALINKKLDQDKNFLLKIMRSAYAEWTIFEKYCQKLPTIDFKQLTTRKIREHYLKIIDFFLKWNGPYLQFIWLSEKILENKVRSIISKRSVKVNQNDFLLLTTPSKEGFFEKQNRKLFELVKLIQANVKFSQLIKQNIKYIGNKLANYPKLQEKFNLFLKEFAWITNSDFKRKFLTMEDVIIKVKDSTLPMSKKTEKVKLRKLIKRLKLNRQDVKIINTARELIYFRAFRTDIQWKIGWYVHSLFKEVAGRMGIAHDNIYYLLHNEITDFLSVGRPLNKGLLTKRKRGYAFIIKNGLVRFYYDEKNINHLKKVVKEPTENKFKELKGVTANQGYARGKAKVINGIEDLHKVKEGDILVTPMTKPAYVFAMKKAAAFITDEGGITCHASIIAREMRKPCVMGTKIATKVLKDGDMVEVDANKGTVKKLN